MNLNAAAEPFKKAFGDSITKGLPMTLPPLQFSSSSSAKSGDIGQTMAFDSSGMTVNYGNGVSQGGQLPAINPLIIGAALVGLIVWKKKS